MVKSKTVRILCVVPDVLNDQIVMRAWEESKTNQEVVRDAIREYFDRWEPDKKTIEAFSEDEDEDEDDDDDDDDEEDAK